MNGDRISRGGALVIALAVQVLVILVVASGLATRPAMRDEAPAMTVSLLAVLRHLPDPPAGMPKVHVRRHDPGMPVPVVPVDIVLDPTALPESQPDPAAIVRTTNQESAGSPVSTDSSISILSRVEPDYPQEAMDRRAQGITSLALLVDTNGRPDMIRIVRSSGDAQLDAAAVRAVQQWKFTPAISDSHVVASWGRLDVDFNLTLFRAQHPDMKGGTRNAPTDPVAMLTAVIRTWMGSSTSRARSGRDRHAFELLSPKLSTLLRKSGPVRGIRFLGVASRPPQGVAQSDPQTLRMLAAEGLVGWNVFEVTQARSRSQWYCAMDAAGQIQDILTF